MKRSNDPIFWSLFGAGGMLAALVGSALVFVTGIAVPLGILVSHDLMGYQRMLGFAQHWLGKTIVFAVIVLFLWHAACRIFHMLHDFGVHARTATKFACYGFAFAASVAAGYALYVIGF
jgi:fumarate reductase subunit D